MSHRPGCIRSTDSGAFYGTCTCEAIDQRNHTEAMNRLADEMAAQRTAFVEPSVDEVALLRAEIDQLKQDLAEIKVLAHPISDPLNVLGGTVACCYRALDQINGIATVALNPNLHWMRKVRPAAQTDSPSP